MQGCCQENIKDINFDPLAFIDEGGGVNEGGVVAKVYFTQRRDNSNTDQITDNL